MLIDRWQNHEGLTPRNWTCGYCGRLVAGDRGYRHGTGTHGIYLCPGCGQPTYFEGDVQVPGVAYGAEVANLPADVAGLYREARNCMAVNAFTAAVLAARKLLMNVAVAQGAEKNEGFKFYVEFLVASGYVPPNARGWVGHIRDAGNDATHEIPAVTRPLAEDLLTFVEMLLKLVFDYPNRVPGHGAAGPT